MSDGPYRSLKMTRPWKKLAETAYYDAYSIDEIADAFLPALDQSCRDEVPHHLWHDLARIFGDHQKGLFSDHKAAEVSELRSQVVGMPLGCALIDAAERLASNGRLGAQALVEATTEAFMQRAARANRQVEEHFYRESTEKRTKNVRDRMERALKRAALGELARQQLNMSTVTKTQRGKKQSNLDDGVQL